ncbi:MAG TPA: hypothetical protein EYP40_03460, partial [Chromatiales bacterium]|nr:hypothetical protein [Chromatiales bacterium]
ADFGPTLACEKLAERHDHNLSVETLRQWMIADGLDPGQGLLQVVFAEGPLSGGQGGLQIGERPGLAHRQQLHRTGRAAGGHLGPANPVTDLLQAPGYAVCVASHGSRQYVKVSGEVPIHTGAMKSQPADKTTPE